MIFLNLLRDNQIARLKRHYDKALDANTAAHHTIDALRKELAEVRAELDLCAGELGRATTALAYCRRQLVKARPAMCVYPLDHDTACDHAADKRAMDGAGD